MTRSRSRCALYTRKSSEEGLEQDFNSLDAQREACAAYVKSQAAEGWRALIARYDDGGVSGGTMNRPALARLLTDIAAGRIDVVVVYKIDRLTRSLADFARMLEIFERHAVSFVSVTQAFNTTSSMGRLTLNVLLSFAQFEREVTGERIRDKIAASKKKGLWMGGTVPLGYDAPRSGTRALVVNEAEAATVRTIFRSYLELGSVHALERRLGERGIRSKRRVTARGKCIGGQAFSRGALFHLLRNRLYLGEIVHKGTSHPGLHPAIIDESLFAVVQRHIDANARRRGASSAGVADGKDGSGTGHLLTGRIFDAAGQRMSPTTTCNRHGRRYRYYVSAPLQQGRQTCAEEDRLCRVPAGALEAAVLKVLRRVLPPHRDDPLEALLRLEVHADTLLLVLSASLLPTVRRHLDAGERVATDPADPARLHLAVPFASRRRGGRTVVEAGARPATRPDPVLIRALRSAHAMLRRDPTGLPVLDQAPDTPHRRRILRLVFLAPDLQRAVLEGRQPAGLTLKTLLADPLPPSWSDQARRFGFDPGK